MIKAQNETEVKEAHSKFLQSGLSKRLQTENPFEDFKKAVEKAVIEQTANAKKAKVSEGDKDFYKETDDLGMTVTIDQPWASLIIYGFKRFLGVKFSHKFRGPIWIHSGVKKATNDEILAAEKVCVDFYETELGEDELPPFPDRYLTTSVLGRVDLVDILAWEEYNETVPEKLKENIEESYVLVMRNPMYLENPNKISARGGGLLSEDMFFKLPKEVHFGSKTLLRKMPMSWWPPKQYKLHSLGRFDFYPLQSANLTREQLVKKVKAASAAAVKGSSGSNQGSVA